MPPPTLVQNRRECLVSHPDGCFIDHTASLEYPSAVPESLKCRNHARLGVYHRTLKLCLAYVEDSGQSRWISRRPEVVHTMLAAANGLFANIAGTFWLVDSSI
jgi:hypothetical protein